MKRLVGTILLIFLVLNMASTQITQADRIQVVASTTLIADVARNVGGDLVEVTTLIPPGADVHSFTPSPRDVAIIAEADVVFVNGLSLEEGLLAIIEGNAPSEPVVVSTGITVLSGDIHAHDDEHDDDEHDEEDHDDEHEHEMAEVIGVLGVDDICDFEAHDDEAHDHHDEDEHEHGICDPHVWTKPVNVMIWTENIAEAYAVADPDNADVYADNAAAYITELEALNTELAELVSELPEEDRILVTNHRFLGYFADAFDFEIAGTVIPSVSTVAEVNPRDLADLVAVIEDEGVRAIFAETTDSTDLAETVSAEVGEQVSVVELYSESLSEGEPADTYITYMRYNVQAIVSALSE